MAAKTKKETAAVAETKETAKKATVKKTREVYLQWYGKEVQLSSITARIEEMWKKEMKRKISELVDLKVYVKPEEGKAVSYTHLDVYKRQGNRGSCPEIPLRWRMDTDHFQHSGFLYRRLVHKQLLLYEYSGHEMR